MTFQERITALDQQLDVGTQQELWKKRQNRTEEEQILRMEELDGVENEQQKILQDMGIELYQQRQGVITVDLDSEAGRMKKQASGNWCQELQKIKKQQARIIREQEQQLRP